MGHFKWYGPSKDSHKISEWVEESSLELGDVVYGEIDGSNHDAHEFNWKKDAIDRVWISTIIPAVFSKM